MKIRGHRAATWVALLLGAAGVVACSQSGESAEAPAVSAIATSGLPRQAEPRVVVSAPLAVRTYGVRQPLGSRDDRLQTLLYADAPRGTGPEIALRFLRALQRGDDIGAARELFVYGRTYFATRDGATLARVMREVKSNARLADAGLCTGARQLNDDAALVSCGRTFVVVHVLADKLAAGVQISKWHPPGDVYSGPHTHAYTSTDV
ncbi:MAG TPA: hypothetical protein VNB24_08995 [Acidimicrobiales bacterium]|nr:hypothetical protein [Acidimicrobiales bacterium]